MKKILIYVLLISSMIVAQSDMLLSQSKKVILNVNNVEIRDALQLLSKGYDISIVIDPDVSCRVTANLYNTPIDTALLILTQSNNLEFEKTGDVYRVKQALQKNNYSLTVENERVAGDFSNADIRQVIADIAKASSQNILIEGQVGGVFTGKLNNVPVDIALKTIIKSSAFEVIYNENIYRVSPKRTTENPNSGRFFVEYSKGLCTIDCYRTDLDLIINELGIQSGVPIISYVNLNVKIDARILKVPLQNAITLLLGGSEFTMVTKDSIILIGNRNSSSMRSMASSQLVHLKHVSAQTVPELLPSHFNQNDIRVVKEQNAILISGVNSDILGMISFLRSIDRPTPQVIINALVVEYSKQLDRTFGIEVGIGKKGYRDASSDELLTLPRSEINLTKSRFKDLATSLGFDDAFTTKLSPDFFLNLRALENEGKARVLAKPSITVLNGHEAAIEVGQTQYYRVEGGTDENKTVRFQPISFGITLNITPKISDSGQIIADIKPEISNPMGINTEGYPNVFRRSVRTTVRLNDNQTLVIGGLLRKEEQENFNKIPILGDLPIIGPLFRTTIKQNLETNLVIYLTPKILKENTVVDLTNELSGMDEQSRSSMQTFISKFKGYFGETLNFKDTTVLKSLENNIPVNNELSKDSIAK